MELLSGAAIVAIAAVAVFAKVEKTAMATLPPTEIYEGLQA